MIRLEYLLIVTLLITGNRQVCYAGELEIPEDFIKWAGVSAKLIAAIATGNMIEVTKTVAEEAKEIIEDKKEDKKNGNSRDFAELNEKVRQLSEDLESLKMDLTSVKSEIIDGLTSSIPDMVELRNCLKEIARVLSFIEGKYNDYVAYIEDLSAYQEDTLASFAKSITSQGINGLPHLLKSLHESFYLKNDDVSLDTVVSLLSGNKLLEAHFMCQRKQSLQQMLYILRNTIILADVKGVLMMQTAYDFKANILGKVDSYKKEKERAQELLQERMKALFANVKIALKNSSRMIWTCDTNQIEDVTYTKFDNLFRNYILNEKSLNFMNSCITNCEVTYWKEESYDCKEDLCKEQKPRDGYLADCTTIKKPATICLSSSGSDRFYEHIEFNKPKESCTNTLIKAKPLRSGLFDTCHYCSCKLDSVENPNSDRYINLRPVVADLHNNYAVTGVRFVKKNHILHIQLKQGRVMAAGVIDESTNSWKEIEVYEINKPFPGKTEMPTIDFDYHKLEYGVENKDWDFSRSRVITSAAFNLGDVDLSDLTDEGKELLNRHVNTNPSLDWGNLHPKDYHLVTGLRIKKNKVKNSGYHLNLELFMTPFNFSSGELYPDQSIWHSQFNKFNESGWHYDTDEDVKDKSEIKIDDFNLPINTEARAKLTSGKNQFVKLTTSSLENDVGQNTIPFIDITSVETNPPVPISGAGIIHKSSPRSGGFLALKLITFDFEPYMS